MGTIFDFDLVTLLNVGHINPDTAWHIPSHTHTHWEFIYFLNGCGRVHLPHATMHPLRYHLMVYPPGLPHEEFADHIEPEETIFFGVNVAGTPPLGSHLLVPDQRGDLRWLCEHLLAEYAAFGASPASHHYVMLFLHHLERAWNSSIPVQHDAVDIAVQYLQAHYAQHITMADLAAVARQSESYLTHRFRARIGVSPMHFLQYLRLETAQRLLVTTDAPIQHIAAQVGFHDPLYFSRAFKTATTLSPSDFRQAKKQNTP